MPANRDKIIKREKSKYNTPIPKQIRTVIKIIGIRQDALSPIQCEKL